MSVLKIYPEGEPGRPELETGDGKEIARLLGARGIRFERWSAKVPIRDDDEDARILAAYAAEIERIKAEGGYRSVDVIHMHPSHPEREALRARFLDEHQHGEDEVRFFVRGRGLFSLHLDREVVEVLCEQGDLIGVPAGTRHWFDMGPAPRFTAIRWFTNPEGWVAHFTGSDIAGRFSRLGA